MAIISSSAMAEPSAALIEAAKKEGSLTTIALPHDWCGYGEVLEGFKKKYGLNVNELNPNAGSGDEIEAIKANKGNTGPQAPDVIDVGLSFGPAAKADNLLMPYKVSTWDTIPREARDEDGYWYGGYYGVLSFGVNADMIKEAPSSFADLADTKYAGAVSLPGDPRTGNSTMMSVYTAGIASSGAAGAEAARKGVEFFQKLKDNGNLVPVSSTAQSLAQGTTPIVMDWDYNVLAMRDKLKGNPPMTVTVPSDAVVAGVYVQAISAYAPHPNAAKLWMEYLYSDEVQVGWLKGYCHPIRFSDLMKRGKIPQELLDKLPAAENYLKAIFPSLDEQGEAKKVIGEMWPTTMSVQ